MRRRTFIGAIGGTALILCQRGLAQPAGRVYRLGFLVESERAQYLALLDELRRQGFVEDVNLAVDRQGFGHSEENLEAIAVAVARAGPDAIFCGGDAAARAVRQATTTIPIVVLVGDIVQSRLVTALAHPGGNITGITLLAAELDGKRLEILQEIVPGVRRMAALVDPRTTAPDQLQALVQAARARGIELSIHHVAAQQDIAPAIDDARATGAQALNVLATPFVNANLALFIERIAAARLPAIHQWPEHAEVGALVGYGPRRIALLRQAAGMLVMVLRGASPADIPVQQPTKIELVINLRTAQALGLTIPPSILARADEVIE